MLARQIGGLPTLAFIEKDKRERDDRIFIVPDCSAFEGDLQDTRRLPRRAIEELEKFFRATNSLEDKKLEFLSGDGPRKGRQNHQEARALRCTQDAHRLRLCCDAFALRRRATATTAPEEHPSLA